VGFEPTISVLERAKTFHASDREATVKSKRRVLALKGWIFKDTVTARNKGFKIFLFSTPSRPTLGPTQPPIEWVQGALSPGVKR
jgi:hypothetical protein